MDPVDFDVALGAGEGKMSGVYQEKELLNVMDEVGSLWQISIEGSRVRVMNGTPLAVMTASLPHLYTLTRMMICSPSHTITLQSLLKQSTHTFTRTLTHLLTHIHTHSHTWCIR